MVKAKKYYGQHFLTDHNITKKIVSIITDNHHTNNPLIEIGPGKGMLTQYLYPVYRNFKAIEIDTEVYDFLQDIYHDKEKIILDDFLKTDMLQDAENIAVVGNFPYNISSQILFKVLENRANVSFCCGMFQKEVAERVCAKNKSKTFGILSVLLQVYFDVSYDFSISPHVFQPPPKVQSAVISLKRKHINLFENNKAEAYFFRIVKTAFNQRRKTLKNALKQLNTTIETPYDKLRAEQLSISDFIDLANILIQEKNANKQ